MAVPLSLHSEYSITLESDTLLNAIIMQQLERERETAVIILTVTRSVNQRHADYEMNNFKRLLYLGLFRPRLTFLSVQYFQMLSASEAAKVL